MDKVKLLVDLYLLIIIVDGIYCDTRCDCTSMIEEHGFIKTKLNQIEFDNYKIKSRLRRLEVSRATSTKGTSISQNDGIESKAPQQKVDQNVSNDIVTNNSKRIDAIDSTLTRVMTVLELHEPNNTDMADIAKEVVQKHRLDKIESKLESMSNVVLKYDTALKKTIRAEKNNRIKFELRVKKMVERVNEYSRNFTGETKNVIDDLKIEIIQKQEQFEEKINGEAININRTVYEHINDIDSSFDNLQDEITETKTKISSLETATVKDNTDGAWSSWQGWSPCSETCGVGVQSRSRTCSNPKPSLLGKVCAGNPLQTRTCNKQQCKDFNVAFTAYDLSTSSTSRSTLVFTSTHLNNGNAYDTRTGKFTCTIPGVYHFSVTLTKRKMEFPYVVASLKINSEHKLAMWWNPTDDDKNMFEVTPLTQSGIFHLMKNDVVDIHGVSNEFHKSYFSTFTGYLITPD